MISLTDNSLKLLQRLYLLRDEMGNVIEKPEEMFNRVANAVAMAELKWGDKKTAGFYAGEFLRVMSSLLFLPNSPTLMNAGKPEGQLSACFVLPVHYGRAEIDKTLKEAAIVQQYDGGTGFSFSSLPAADNDLFAGPVDVMRQLDEVTSSGFRAGHRRGANMGILDVSHPDIIDFIRSKSHPGAIENFNISIGIPDSFMQACQSGNDWQLIDPVTERVTRNIPAMEIWDDIVRQAWLNGEPGLIFTDAINRDNPTPELGQIHATNPCGEVPLLPYEPCNLGSLNLSQFIVESGEGRQPDWNKLEEVISLAVRFLDDVIEINHYPLEPIREMAFGNRKIGLGVMGWADFLSILQIPYESVRAIDLAGKLMGFIRDKCREVSEQLAAERGVFPNHRKSIYADGLRLRNATLMSVAPTGSISVIAGTSSSIEPHFALAYRRVNLHGEPYFFMNPHFISHLRAMGIYSVNLENKVMRKGSLEGINEIPSGVHDLFKTAFEIAPEWHLLHQAAFQRYTDNAVSKTINLPFGAGIDDVVKIFRKAWQHQLKGVTVYRDRSRQKQVLYKGVREISNRCGICKS